MPSYKVEVLTRARDGSDDWAGNAVRWPDYDSADKAGYDLLCRWFVPEEYRVAESPEPPNRPTWAKWTLRRS